MAEYDSMSIKKLIKSVESNKLLLPSIQRNFVWPYEKACELFESIMRDYPIGTFLFWAFDEPLLKDFVFNSFVDSIDEFKGGLLRGERVKEGSGELLGVLDGQQRITSLYIGIKGYINVRLKGKKKADPASYEKRFLCIDVLHRPVDYDDKYLFNFIRDDDISRLLEEEVDGETVDHIWVKVGDIAPESFCSSDLVESLETKCYDGSMPQHLRKTVDFITRKLNAAIVFKNNINFYKAEDMDLREVVDIFVRVNSGGQKLSASDLMLSIAAGEQKEDIHVLLNDAVDGINAIPNTDWTTRVDKELVLTAGLMFTGASSLSLQKKESYSRDSINKILSNWEQIIDSMKLAVRFIEYLGFSNNSLTSKNLILPVAYHFYLNQDIDASSMMGSGQAATKNKIFIRQWLFRAMVNSVFRDGTGSTLLRIRNIMETYDKGVFPLKNLMEAQSKRNLNISMERIDELLDDVTYTSPLARPLLTVIRPGSEWTPLEIDHIWPKSVLSSKKELKKRLPSSPDSELLFYQENLNSITNLELLPSLENNEKNDRLFHEWVNDCHPDKNDAYFATNCIPNEEDASYLFHEFRSFLEKRRALLRATLRQKIPSKYEDILSQYHLSD